MKKRKGKNVEVRDEPDDAAARAADPDASAAGTGNRTAEAREASPDSIEKLQARIESLEESLLRSKADFQNLQRRSAIERSEAIRYANAELMQSLLGVLDDFERSLEAAGEGDHVAPIVDGVRLVYDNLLKALYQHGLERIDALHQPFDPYLHQAVMQRPSDDHPDGTVVEEVARGYRLRDRVIRPTKVIVSKTPDPKERMKDEG